ncbi:hypothetical protein BZA70DRAFT_292115 [Myxozyma melibiosi]|uniref:GDP/GTP exchange factor Sec2 N-terminal domain-containing protein n=1 Tax=Myxozyma melibiosi TaxID=54550 RepID=A0ABR1EYB8_9ASCO
MDTLPSQTTQAPSGPKRRNSALIRKSLSELPSIRDEDGDESYYSPSDDNNTNNNNHDTSFLNETEKLQALVHDLTDKLRDSERLALVQEHDLESKSHEIEYLAGELADANRQNQQLTRELELEKSLENKKWAEFVPSATQVALPPTPDNDNRTSASFSPDDQSSRTPCANCASNLREVENLRLDLADIHLKLLAADKAHAAETEDHRAQIEKYRAECARLTREISELQEFLSDKFETIDKDGRRRNRNSGAPASSTLAYELDGTGPASIDDLIKENQKLQETNSAMTEYIERITQKLLDSAGLEYLLESESTASTPQMPSSTSPELSRPPREQRIPSGSDFLSVSGPPPAKSAATSPQISSSSTSSSRRRSRIGIGINIDVANHDSFSSSTLSPAKNKSPMTGSPHLNRSASTSAAQPSSPGYRRVSSHGQKMLLPLRLTDTKSSPNPSSTSPNPPPQQFVPPAAPHRSVSAESTTSTPNLNLPKKKRSSWLNIFGGSPVIGNSPTLQTPSTPTEDQSRQQ